MKVDRRVGSPPAPKQPSSRAQSPAPPPASSSTATQLRSQRIAEVVEHLRTNHNCSHEKWRWVRGGHQCEECMHWLREYIFECQQCQLQACNRCRRNRL